MLTESELEAIEKRLDSLQGDEHPSILHRIAKDATAILADLKLYKKALEEATPYVHGLTSRVVLERTAPALATILKGVKG